VKAFAPTYFQRERLLLQVTKMPNNRSVRVRLYVCEPGERKPDFSLAFNLPEVPRPGDYISVYREDKETPHTEDLIVRHIWWNLETTEARTSTSEDEERVGNLREIGVECEMALGPCSTDQWRDRIVQHEANSRTIKRFDVSRFSVREKDLSRRPKREGRPQHA
jgi:hypothetical protein